jgi:hypothetical protein
MIQDHYEYYNLVISHDLFSTSKHSNEKYFSSKLITDLYSRQMDIKNKDFKQNSNFFHKLALFLVSS